MVACVTQQRNNDEHPSPTTTHLLLDTSSPLFLLPRYIPRIPGGQVFINWNRQTKETTFSPTFKEERNMGARSRRPMMLPDPVVCAMRSVFFPRGARDILLCYGFAAWKADVRMYCRQPVYARSGGRGPAVEGGVSQASTTVFLLPIGGGGGGGTVAMPLGGVLGADRASATTFRFPDRAAGGPQQRREKTCLLKSDSLVLYRATSGHR